MINHARTLLLNKPRSRMHYSDYGYEYVPTDFRPVVLSSTLTNIRQLFFGANPDNYFLNFRVNELMSYIHTTELAEYVYKLDPRVTYWPAVGRPYFEPASKRVSITQIYGAPRRLNVAGNLFALTAVGKSLSFYTVSLRRIIEAGASKLVIDVRHQGNRNAALTVPVPDPSSPPIIKLPDTELNLRLNPTVANLYQKDYVEILTELDDFIVTENYKSNAVSAEKIYLQLGDTGLEAQWLVETKVNPAPVITTVLPAIEMLGEPVYLEIFGVEDKEPYLTFKNLWFDHPLPAYRLSGIVLALIYRTEEMRGKNV